MNAIVKSLMRQILLVTAVLGVLLASNGWASTIDTTVGTPEPFTFQNLQANLQISIAGAAAAGSGGFPNNTQTIMASAGFFEILGTGPIILGINPFLLLITVPTLPNFSFTLDPGNDGAGLIQVTNANFATMSGTVDITGNRPGNGSFNAFGPAAAFAFVDLALGGSKVSSGLASFTPPALVGFNFGTGPVVPTSFFVYGADTDTLEVMSSNSGSLTVLPGADPIPEPGTLLLIGTGLVGLGAGARRRKKQ